MTRHELIEKYCNYFLNKGHQLISGRSLVPENDPTVLFTTAGMHPLVPYLSGQQTHPQGQRLVNVQKCVRTGDIDVVGDTSHLTFFEMLGNWSLGDYFKKESIEMSFEFLTSPQYLNIPIERLRISIFAGDKDVPRDDEAKEIWLSLGVAPQAIVALGREDNWWGPAGETGPCGPDTEIFYDRGEKNCSNSNCQPGCDCGRFIEIWNNVFMQYHKDAEGNYTPLEKQCVDTGMGVERTVMVLEDLDSVYDTDAFSAIIARINELSSQNVTDEKYQIAQRVIADHVRAAVMMIGDAQEVLPSNVGRGYVLRRLIRRAIQHGQRCGFEGLFLADLGGVVVDVYKQEYPELQDKKERILRELEAEENAFNDALRRGKVQFEKETAKLKAQNIQQISGQLAFRLYDTFGFPLSMTKEMAENIELTVDEAGFNDAYVRHQEVSREGASASFKGGLAGHSDVEVRYHTATHLLHEALRQVLGDEVAQKGSNITPERLRFDFSFSRKMTPEEIVAVENIVNEIIEKDLKVSVEILPLEKAKSMENIRALFSEKYENDVSVYSIGDFSHEICGGPHVEHTNEIGKFQIKKEQSSAKGIRRIKAIINEG